MKRTQPTPNFFPSAACANETTNQSTALFQPSNRIIGKGRQGEVVLAKLNRVNESPLSCAAKLIRSSFYSTNANEAWEIHQRLSGTSNGEFGILPFLGCYSAEDESENLKNYHVMSLCDLILHDCLSQISSLNQSNPPLFFQILADFIRFMVRGLTRLEACRVIHHDINPKNIGFYKKGWCLFDFDLAEDYKQFSESLIIIGTPLYVAPEICAREKNFPFSCDVWSFGQILRQFLGHKLLFTPEDVLKNTMPEGSNELARYLYEKGQIYEKNREIATRSFQGNLLITMGHQSNFLDALSVLMNSMCAINPEHRPSVSTLNRALDILESFLKFIPAPEENELENFFQPFIAQQKEKRIQRTPSLHESPVEVINLESRSNSPLKGNVPHCMSSTLPGVASMQLDQIINEGMPGPDVEKRVSNSP